jgi:hypothetical protein
MGDFAPWNRRAFSALSAGESFAFKEENNDSNDVRDHGRSFGPRGCLRHLACCSRGAAPSGRRKRRQVGQRHSGLVRLALPPSSLVLAPPARVRLVIGRYPSIPSYLQWMALMWRRAEATGAALLS